MDKLKENFKNFIPTINFDEVFPKFEIYFNELIKYNKHTNLTAITEKKEVFIKHFLDSCLSVKYIKPNSSVVDIGTGAGFPGIPLKIVRNDINLYLVDSLNKRITFLNELQKMLNIEYTTYHARAEDFCKINRECFDVCVSRAVAKLNTLIEYCLPLIKVGGIFIAYKGNNIKEEITQAKKALNILGGEIINIEKFDLPENMGLRNLIIIKKIKNTPNKYPRGKNLPKKTPL